MNDLSLDNYSQKVVQNLHQSPYFDDISFIFKNLDGIQRMCWISGGAVRDFLIDRVPTDIDLTTDALESEILNCFPKAILVGQSFGVYKIPLNGQIYDLTVFRKEDHYIDGRRPSAIERSSPEQDAWRRDFTINALFFNLKTHQIVDYVGGLRDLLSHKIVCVGSAEKRFQEDHLRILRLIRFKFQLKFEIDGADYTAALKLAALTTTVSGERLSAELSKLKTYHQRKRLYWDELFCKIMKHNDFNVNHSLLQRIQMVVDDEYSLFFELLLSIGLTSEQQKKLRNRFKYNNQIESYLLKCCEINQFVLSQASESDYILRFDKSIDYLNIVQKFAEYFLISASEFQKIIKIFTEFKVPLVSSKDLHFIDDRTKYSTILTDVRRWQIENKIENKSECLLYIKNKYT
jgi:tRNA nucleotidyltransferase/poly(A) polymerase